MLFEAEMKVYLAGYGRVGKAFSQLMKREGVNHLILSPGWESSPVEDGILMLAVPDSQVAHILRELYPSIPESLRIIHFAGGVPVSRERLFLLHPYSSVDSGTDLGSVRFVLSGGKDEQVDRFIGDLGLSVFRTEKTPATGYHTSAVFSGNFVQYLTLVGVDLLEREGFRKDEATTLVRQLLFSSVENALRDGTDGVTGPAARKDTETVNIEQDYLASLGREDLADLYGTISKLIEKAVSDGHVL